MRTYTEKELIEFGNYILSDERKQLVSEDNRDMVHDADVANFTDKIILRAYNEELIKYEENYERGLAELKKNFGIPDSDAIQIEEINQRIEKTRLELEANDAKINELLSDMFGDSWLGNKCKMIYGRMHGYTWPSKK